MLSHFSVTTRRSRISSASGRFHPSQARIYSVENGFICAHRAPGFIPLKTDLTANAIYPTIGGLLPPKKLEKVKAGVEPPPYNIVFNYMREL